MNAPDPGFVDGQRTVGSNARVTAAARALASELWRGGSDEQYHFLLYLCGHAAEVVQTATDCFDLARADGTGRCTARLIRKHPDVPQLDTEHRCDRSVGHDDVHSDGAVNWTS